MLLIVNNLLLQNNIISLYQWLFERGIFEACDTQK
jgi:hypothetical protein